VSLNKKRLLRSHCCCDAATDQSEKKSSYIMHSWLIRYSVAIILCSHCRPA